MTWTVGSLFSGIGGLDLGLERAGFEVRWQCESDPFARRVLAKHWPDVPCYPDAWTLTDDVGAVDVLAGGYPCQPFSFAGRRAGEDDPRNLWPAYLRALRLLRPGHALLENVPGHLSLGFGRVLADLAALGYDTEWTCLPAAAVGAPHLRWRLFAIAHAECGGLRDEPVTDGGCSGAAVLGDDGAPWDVVADTFSLGLVGRSHIPTPAWTSGRNVVEGSHAWATEPDVGRVAYGVPNRVDRLRTLGNAVVPQVAELIGRRLLAHLTVVSAP